MKRPLQGNATRYWPEFIPRRFTTSQPYTYRDTLTLLRYLEELRHHLDELHDQVNQVAESGNDLTDNTSKQVQAIRDELESLAQRVNELSKVVDRWEGQAVIYNPTRGRYEKSRSAMRDMFRELAVFGARTDQMATLTVEEAAKTQALEMAVLGNRTVFGNKEPRVTPVEPRKDDDNEDHA